MPNTQRSKPRAANNRSPQKNSAPEATPLAVASEQLAQALEEHGEAVRAGCLEALDTIAKEGTGLAKKGPLGSAAKRAIVKANELSRSLNTLDHSLQ